MKILIIYPHGLGDCLMLTPAIREFYFKHKTKPSIAILERFKSSKIFDNNPYVEKIFPVLKDAWNDFGSYSIGFVEVQKQGNQIALENGLIPIYFNHPPPSHKILICARELGVILESTQIDVFISDNDKKMANELINNFVGDNSYGFIQTETGVPLKNLPNGFGENWLKKTMGLQYFIEVGKTFNYNDFNINIQFEIMRNATAICIPDSVFYHAASGMNKNIDFAYFGRGKEVYERVRNLNKKISENLYYIIPKI